MKKILLLILLVTFSFTNSIAQIFDCHRRVFSFEKIQSINIIKTSDEQYEEFIELYLENGFKVLINKKHSQDYRCLFDTIDGCERGGYCKLHYQIYEDILKGKFDEYIVYFKAYYNLGKIIYYEFSLISYRELDWNIYFIENIEYQDEKNEVIIGLKNETEQFDISINLQHNPIDKPLSLGSKVVHVKCGILDYFKVLTTEEFEEIEDFMRKKGIVK